MSRASAVSASLAPAHQQIIIRDAYWPSPFGVSPAEPLDLHHTVPDPAMPQLTNRLPRYTCLTKDAKRYLPGAIQSRQQSDWTTSGAEPFSSQAGCKLWYLWNLHCQGIEPQSTSGALCYPGALNH